MTEELLEWRAGPAATRLIRERGLRPEDIRVIAGASGGPKWLVLGGIDRAIVGELLPRLATPVHLIGSSIGAWRFACYAQSDASAALARFEQAYLAQRYSPRPERAEITRVCAGILEHLLGPAGSSEIVSHPRLRSHVMTVRSRAPTASDRRAALAAGLLLAALANLVSRRALGLFFERALFHDPRDAPPFLDPPGLPLRKVALTERNLRPAVLATGAIPMVLEGVSEVSDAPPGIYRDGGVIDYHLDLPLSGHDGIALYPHFYGRMIPGWFDKKLAWRRPHPANVERVLIVSPSPRFVARLPGGKIPDRGDFAKLPQPERIARWQRVVAESRRLGDEFLETMQGERVAERLRPLA